MGFSLDEPAARPLVTPYSGAESGRRYYQDAAIRAVLEKLVQCEKAYEPKRDLLSLATGGGKTFAAQIGLTATPRQLVIKANTLEAEADAKITADNLK